MALNIPDKTYNPRPRGKGAKRQTPPNPPTDRCTNCADFSYQGSSANYGSATAAMYPKISGNMSIR